MMNAVSYMGPQTNSKEDIEAAERNMEFVVSILDNILTHNMKVVGLKNYVRSRVYRNYRFFINNSKCFINS